MEKRGKIRMRESKIQRKIFYPTLIIVLLAIICMIAIPDQMALIVNDVFAFLTYDFGWAYLLIFAGASFFSIYIALSRYGTIRLGASGEGKEYSEFSWAAMMFTAGLGVGLVVQSFVEPLYFLSTPPFRVEAMSTSAYEYAHMYSQFLWGPLGWACYVPATIAVAWVLFIKKKDVLRFSAACEPVLGRHTGGIFGVVMDVVVMVGTIGGIATSLGLGVPIVSKIICYLTGIKDSIWLLLGILFIWFLVFGGATFLGLDKGIKKLSSLNIYILFAFIAVVILKSPVLDIINLEVNSVGLMIDNMGMLLLGTDPIDKGGFPQNWTVFYWAWLLTFVPMMALFVARISRGRTIRQVVFGEAVWGGLGCMLSFGLLGGYSLYLQHSGSVDLVSILNSSGRETAIIAILETLPFSKVMIVVYLLLLFLFLATTVDSTSVVLASICTKKLASDEEPTRWNRVLWSLILMLVALGLSVVGGLQVIQTASLVVAAPLIVVELLVILSVRKFFNEYSQNKKDDKIDVK